MSNEQVIGFDCPIPATGASFCVEFPSEKNRCYDPSRVQHNGAWYCPGGTMGVGGRGNYCPYSIEPGNWRDGPWVIPLSSNNWNSGWTFPEVIMCTDFAWIVVVATGWTGWCVSLEDCILSAKVKPAAEAMADIVMWDKLVIAQIPVSGEFIPVYQTKHTWSSLMRRWRSCCSTFCGNTCLDGTGQTCCGGNAVCSNGQICDYGRSVQSLEICLHAVSV